MRKHSNRGPAGGMKRTSLFMNAPTVVKPIKKGIAPIREAGDCGDEGSATAVDIGPEREENSHEAHGLKYYRLHVGYFVQQVWVEVFFIGIVILYGGLVVSADNQSLVPSSLGD